MGALGDDMMLLDLKQKQHKMKTEDICVIRWSKLSGVYIMNFSRPKYVMCKRNGVREAHEVLTRQAGAPYRGGV